MKKTIRLCIALSILICGQQVKSQDIHFSQIFETPLLRNPALAGLFQGDIRIQSVYRTQWNSVTVPYRTGSLDGEVKLPIGKANDYLTLGAQFLYDKAGTVALTATHILPTINYHKSLSDDKNSYLSLGFIGGWVQRSIDRSKMTTNSQFDGVHYNENLSNGESFTSGNYSYFDVGVGMSYNSQIGENPDNNYFIGLSYQHFNKPKKLSFYTDNSVEGTPKIVGSAGIRMSITDLSYFTIQADYSKQGPYTETVAGALYTWKFGNGENPQYAFHTGAYLRWKDALIPVAKLQAKSVALAFSYDANISPLRTASTGRGGFEVSLTYQKFFDRYNTTKEAIRCPRF
ncbi:MAG: PorP/SprF family type IX secretion system membrane protein [Chitinophagaceae bacterium]|nr:PorP/SprF family type IX secretion system membrane protein [Bacteroidota bacterium]MCC6257740.1 PorP/SprF family type IX secretion system membrane protein [Chitinophagaceae bacterium]MCW5916114.1 PorP/SprF family type IX secretion system membrane protein [Ferruginibacter sp.]